MTSPFHHTVGLMLPAWSNTARWSMPNIQSRCFHPMGVGSRAGSSEADGVSARFTAEEKIAEELVRQAREQAWR